MEFAKPVVVRALVVGMTAGTALAGGHDKSSEELAMIARQSHMQLYQHNLTILGKMAQGGMEYDANAAQAAANNLVALTGLNQMSYWVPGSDSAALEESNLKAALFDNVPDAMAKGKSVGEAVAAMAGAADSLEGVQANIRALGGACTACHKLYRESDN